jgi:predicted nucleic acid-binding protein
MSQIRIFLDTNILVYAHDSSSQYHTDAANLLTMVFENSLQGVIAEQNLIELYRILTNPVAMRSRSLSASQAKQLIQNTYLTGNFELVYLTKETIQKTLELAVQKNITSAKIFDLRLAAVALSAQINYFIIYNTKDFTEIDGLTALLPQEISAL